MVEENAVYLEPSNLTQRISRHTKGIMISLGILVVSASIATVGTIIEEWITMTLGYVVAGISSVSYLVFFILFIASVKKFGRIEKELIGVTNRIFGSFLFAFFFTLAGFAALYGDIMDSDPSFFISRIYGFLALLCYMFLFLSLDKLFKQLNALDYFPREKRRRKFFVLILAVIFLVEVIDTALRPILFRYFSGFKTVDWYVTYVNRSMTWVILVFLIISVGLICYELFRLSNDWLDIDNEINQKFFQLPLKSFDERFRNKNFMFYLSFSMSIFLSIFYVVGYLIMYGFRNNYVYDYVYENQVAQFGFSIGPFVGLAIVVALYYLIRIIFNYQKISHLSRESSNYGIIISIATTLSPFILIAGFFFNVVFDIRDGDLFLISRILMIVGILLFSLGTYFNTKSLDKLKSKEKSDKDLKQRLKNLLVPLSGLTLILLIIIDSIIRLVIWNTYEVTGDDYTQRREIWRGYVGDTLWTGWVFSIVFTIVLIALIVGFKYTEKDILDLLPNYAKIPAKVKRAKVVVQPTVVAKPIEKPVKAVVEIKIGHCSGCGEKIDERFRFCPFCGVQEVDKETIPKGKFCANCGFTIKKQFRFCPSCGVQFE